MLLEDVNTCCAEAEDGCELSSLAWPGLALDGLSCFLATPRGCPLELSTELPASWFYNSKQHLNIHNLYL